MKIFWTILALISCMGLLAPKPSSHATQDVETLWSTVCKRAQIHSGPNKTAAPDLYSSTSSEECPDELVTAVALIENHKRSCLLQRVEILGAKLALTLHRYKVWDYPDFSLGPHQMKLSTAFWVRSGFSRPVPLQSRTSEELRGMVELLCDSSSSALLMRKYLDWAWKNSARGHLQGRSAQEGFKAQRTRSERTIAFYNGNGGGVSAKESQYISAVLELAELVKDYHKIHQTN